MARYARRAVAVSAVSAGLFFGFTTTAWATPDASDAEPSSSKVVATRSHDDKQQIRVGDTTPEVTPATSEDPQPNLDSTVTDTVAPAAQAVRTLPTTVDDTVDTTMAAVGARLAPLDQATAGGATELVDRTAPLVGSVTAGLTEVTTPVADTVDTTGTRIQTVVSSSAEAVDTVGHETGDALCGATGSGLCMSVPVPGPGDSGDGLPGIEDVATTLPVDDGSTAETPENGDAFPVLLGGLALPMLPDISDAATLQDTLRTSAQETARRAARTGGLDLPVPVDEPRPTGPEGNGPGSVAGGAAQIASTLVDVRLPVAHHASAVPADAWRLPGSVTFEPGHSPD
jgi:hypothetical protein